MKQEFPKNDFGVIIEKNNGKEIIDYLINKGFNNTECWTGSGALGMYSIPKESKTITYHDIVVSKTYTLEELKALDNIETKNIKVTELSKFSGKTTIVKINNKNEYNRLKKYYPNMFDYKEGYNYYLVDKTNSGLGNKPYDSNKYTTINFENIDFMEKKIIGYKLIKPEYEKAASKIIEPHVSICFDKTTEYKIKKYISLIGFDTTIKELKNAGVLDLWFEPVYFEEFKEETLSMGSFSLKVTKEGIFHKSENITEFVKELYNFYTALPSKFTKYDCIVDEITFKKCGCESNITKGTDWFEVWNKYKEFQK